VSAIGVLLETRVAEEKLAEVTGSSEIKDTADPGIDTSSPKTSQEMVAEAKKRFNSER
jgi:hypothetical protein